MTLEPTRSSTPTKDRKRGRWWNYFEGSGGRGDALELQPLQAPSVGTGTTDEHHFNNSSSSSSSSSTAPTGTLERILGLDSPILRRKYVDEVDEGGESPASSPWKYRYYYNCEYVPPDIPLDVQLWRRENIAIPACYLTVGILQGMLRPLLNVYPLDLGATEAQQMTLASIATLPSAIKIAFGFLSDNVPIAGYRRKPYMLAGWLITVASMAILLCTTDLTLPVSSGDDGDDGTETPSRLLSNPNAGGKPSMVCLMLVFFVAGCGIWLADVMADSLVAQKAPLEPDHARGGMQANCYASRFFGLALAAPVSTYLYSHAAGNRGPAVIVSVIMVTPLLTVLPLLPVLVEERDAPVPPTADQCREIWKTVCSRAVWQPMGFIYLYNLLQVPNAAWRQYLKSVLGFTASQLNILLTASYFLLYLGTISYRSCFAKASWRRLYQGCVAVTGLLSLAQLALIRGYTAGLSPFLFALGDDALSEFVVGVQLLPVAVLMVSLCPAGSEGASYAMFTTAWNSAMLLAQAAGSSVLLGIWDVGRETMLAGDLDGLFRLSVLTTLIQVSPVFFVHWLPHGRDDLIALAAATTADGGGSSSKVGGGIFLLVVLGSVLYVFAVALLNVLAPGWAGES